jgi:AhpD family alkylhydroperoxidase
VPFILAASRSTSLLTSAEASAWQAGQALLIFMAAKSRRIAESNRRIAFLAPARRHAGRLRSTMGCDRGNICAMKISLVLINCILAGVALFFPVSANLAGPSPTASPTPKIDPIEANDPEFSGNFDSLYQKTWSAGAVPEKYKQLTGVSISIVERCETCLGWHMKQAVRLGASKAELVESIRLGLLTGGSITIPTVRKAYELFADLKVK